jgi:L-phenylalanine/L-methionine N-acetyltransferase
MAEDARPHAAFTIRPAAPRDARSFLELFRVVAAEGRFVRTDVPNRDVRQYRQAFRTSVTSDRARYLALEGDRVIGDIGVEREEHPVTRHVATIGMMVAPEWRGRGIGTALLESAIDWCRRSGVEKIELSVYPDNDAARALYAKFGFREEGRLTGRSKKAIGYRDEVVMGCWLNGGPP